MTPASSIGEGQGFPSVPASSIPAVTAEQMREVDRIAVDEFGLLLIQMMENAGARLAELALRRFRPAAVAVLCGRGGNGGGGLVAARHLANRGVGVGVTLVDDADRLGEVPRHQLAILERMGVSVGAVPEEADLVIDALIGYSLRGDPRRGAAELIRWANTQEAPVCSLDLPSGLDATTGTVGDPCVRANATLTLALPKSGCMGGSSRLGSGKVTEALRGELGAELLVAGDIRYGSFGEARLSEAVPMEVVQGHRCRHRLLAVEHGPQPAGDGKRWSCR